MPRRHTPEPRGRWLGRTSLGLALALGVGVPLVWLVADGVSPVAAVDEVPVRSAAPVAKAVAVAAEPLSPTPAPSPAPVAAAVLVPAAPPLPAATPAGRSIPRLRDPAGEQTPDLADFVNPGEVPTMAEVIDRLRAAGVTGGLAAFNPPGTRPALAGIAAPEGTELPPGYVRHHQFTDDGRRLEPILLFAPDHPLVVAAVQAAGAGSDGAPVSLQARDLMVPAELVPAGLPARRIVVPPPGEPGK